MIRGLTKRLVEDTLKSHRHNKAATTTRADSSRRPESVCNKLHVHLITVKTAARDKKSFGQLWLQPEGLRTPGCSFSCSKAV